ncbi:PIR Superfamily Protein [Plasmodium ovale wallikeri]|uniref:PIR Superfamily Protein n=1 Tax=Plasmodium ovale wallikeri TaxID=864142 RepID=A0A1A9AHW4_PLAOA|nr:PIR Superfamily Protein [Plasmodium ovale wallikeri]SBT57342.1 PIR Superfamily Protein [Plasmodium ovale wallikeri]
MLLYLIQVQFLCQFEQGTVRTGPINFMFIKYKDMPCRLNIDQLPSNKYKDELLKRTNFTKLEKEGAFDENPSENYQMLIDFNRNLMVGYHNIKRTCSPGADPKCCRDVNYLLDLVTIFIKKSKIDKGEKDDLIKHVEEYWKDKLVKRNEYNCPRELDEDSMRKRCILKQLYDYCDDKSVTEKKELQYNEYLNRKWDRIINYTNSNNKYLYYNIKYNNNNERINFGDFLLNPRDFSFMNCQALEKYDITFSDEKTFNELENASQVPYTIVHQVARAEPGRETIAGTGEETILSRDLGGDTQHHVVAQLGHAHRAENAMEIDGSEEAVGAQAETSLWETALSAGFTVAGTVFFFFFLYKFSPVGPWINTLIRKPPEVGKRMYEDESLLFLNHPEYKDHYISYNSI